MPTFVENELEHGLATWLGGTWLPTLLLLLSVRGEEQGEFPVEDVQGNLDSIAGQRTGREPSPVG